MDGHSGVNRGFQEPQGRKERLTAMIEITRAVGHRAALAGRLGLPATADDETLLRAIDKMIAAREAGKRAETVSAAEQSARAEDRRIVVAAHKAGKIPASRIEFWCDAMAKDRAGNRYVLASLAPGLPQLGNQQMQTADDADMANAYAKITGIPLARATHASSLPRTAPTVQTQPAPDDALYTEAAWQMGPLLRAGLEPPAGNITYFEDPNAPRVVMNADGTGYWVDPMQQQRDSEMAALELQQQARMREQNEREQASLREFEQGR
jgi:hypothetical protein